MLYQLSYSGDAAIVGEPRLSLLDMAQPNRQQSFEAMRDHPKSVGDRSTLAVMLALEAKGFRVYLPFSENTRCDLVIDDGNQLCRVQCKTGRLRGGAVRFNACSSYAHHPNPKIAKRDYWGEIDYFAVYCRETGGVYLVPFAEVPVKRQGALRVEPARNGQVRLIRLARNYELCRVEISTSSS